MPPIDSSAALLILWALIGYGLGSVPFGLILARAMKLGNLRGRKGLGDAGQMAQERLSDIGVAPGRGECHQSCAGFPGVALG